MQGNKQLKKKVIHILLTGVVCSLFTFSTSAQDSDSVKTKKAHIHSAKKAMLFSVVCPGLGQIYNQKYWKLPIIYVGLGTAAYFFVTNQQYYNTYNSALKIRDAGGKDPYYNLYSAATLSDEVSYYRRNVDLCVIIAAGIYLLQIVDANVDGQLHGFNVSDDISLKFIPQFAPSPISGSMCFQPGFTLVKKL